MADFQVESNNYDDEMNSNSKSILPKNLWTEMEDRKLAEILEQLKRDDDKPDWTEIAKNFPGTYYYFSFSNTYYYYYFI